ncbi:hypothetical protein IWQ62_006234, partial [Dispira parvispora]
MTPTSLGPSPTSLEGKPTNHQYRPHHHATDSSVPQGTTAHQRITQPYPQGSTSTEPQKKKRQTQACEYCRQKKIKCNSSRPTCDNCKKRGLTCQYSNQNGKRIQRQGLFENLEKRLENMERLIEPLKPNECTP